MTWRVELSGLAKRDLRHILRRSVADIGPEQARRYGAAIEVALRALRRGPAGSGARERPDLGDGIFLRPVTPGSARSSHLIAFTADAANEVIVVARILHHRMDLAAHLRDDDDAA